MKYKKAIIATVLFLITLLITYLLHINIFRVNVIFYSALVDVVIAVFISSIGLTFLRYYAILNVFEKTQLILIWCLVGYSLAITVPTVLDRSLSFYLLEKLDQRGGGIKLSQFGYVFSREYLNEHRLIDVRLTEQKASGTIVIKNDCVILTDKGRNLARFSRYFRKHFLAKNRLLMGKYSDDLIDPFRHSKRNIGYECKL